MTSYFPQQIVAVQHQRPPETRLLQSHRNFFLYWTTALLYSRCLPEGAEVWDLPNALVQDTAQVVIVWYIDGPSQTSQPSGRSEFHLSPFLDDLENLYAEPLWGQHWHKFLYAEGFRILGSTLFFRFSIRQGNICVVSIRTLLIEIVLRPPISWRNNCSSIVRDLNIVDI